MASNASVTVSVERVVHDTIRDIAQRIFDQHGIALHSFNLEWEDISDLSSHRMQCSRVRAVTSSYDSLPKGAK